MLEPDVPGLETIPSEPSTANELSCTRVTVRHRVSAAPSEGVSEERINSVYGFTDDVSPYPNTKPNPDPYPNPNPNPKRPNTSATKQEHVNSVYGFTDDVSLPCRCIGRARMKRKERRDTGGMLRGRRERQMRSEWFADE